MQGSGQVTDMNPTSYILLKLGTGPWRYVDYQKVNEEEDARIASLPVSAGM